MRRCIYCHVSDRVPHSLSCPTRPYPHLTHGCWTTDPTALQRLGPSTPALAFPPAPSRFVNHNDLRAQLTQLLAEQGLHRTTGVRPSTLVQLIMGVIHTLEDIEADRQRGREVRVPPFPTITGDGA